MSTNSPSTPHITDERLAALDDGELVEREADELRAHLAGCQDCRTRHEQITALAQQLTAAPAPNPKMARQLTARAEQATELNRKSFGWWIGAPVLAAAAALALLLWPGGDATQDGSEEITPPGLSDSWQARGEPHSSQPVQLTLYRLGETLEPVDDSAVLHSGTHRLAVAVKHLPAHTPRAVAVYAREPSGRVTWIRPTWTNPADHPACLRLPDTAGVLPPTKGVELLLRSGQIEVGLLVMGGVCDLPELDARLEAGWSPVAGKEGVLQARRLTLEVDDR